MKQKKEGTDVLSHWKYITVKDENLKTFLGRHITRELDVEKVHKLMDEEIMKILTTIGRKAPYELN